MDGLTLLAEARAAGLKVAAEGDLLVIRGPRRSGEVARRLLARKADVMAALRQPSPEPGIVIDRVPAGGGHRGVRAETEAEVWAERLGELVDEGEVHRHLGHEADRRARDLLASADPDPEPYSDALRALVLRVEALAWPDRYARAGLEPPEAMIDRSRESREGGVSAPSANRPSAPWTGRAGLIAPLPPAAPVT